MVPDKVKPPAIVLIVLGALGLLAAMVSLAMPRDPESMRTQFEEIGWDAAQIDSFVTSMERFGVAGNALGVAIAAFVLFAGIRMFQGKNWGIAFAGSILAMIPCWCCCLIGLPVGIWSILVLLDKDVKAAFDAPSAPPPL